MTTDWPTIDPSADLFGGDLFGDELLDMYNPSVARKFVCEVSEQFNFFGTTLLTAFSLLRQPLTTSFPMKLEVASNTTIVVTLQLIMMALVPLFHRPPLMTSPASLKTTILCFLLQLRLFLSNPIP
jgi:hypothetical protein